MPAFLAMPDMVKSSRELSSMQATAALRMLQSCCSGQCLGAGGMTQFASLVLNSIRTSLSFRLSVLSIDLGYKC